MIDLRQLQALSAVASEGSVARAATRLGWSQPTVDYHLKNLDRLVGAPLTTRSTRGSSLTAAGALMLERGEDILGLADRALADVREHAELGRVRLRFGTFPTAAAVLLPGIAGRLAEIGIELDTRLEEVVPLVTHINQRTLDAALIYTASGYRPPFRTDVHAVPLLTDPMLIALPSTHRLASRPALDRAALLELADERWVTGSTSGDSIDELVREIFSSQGLSPETTIRTDDYSVVLGIVAAGMAVAHVPQLIAGSAPDGVALRPVDDPRFARELLLAAPAGPKGPSAAVRQLAEAVRRTISAVTT